MTHNVPRWRSLVRAAGLARRPRAAKAAMGRRHNAMFLTCVAAATAAGLCSLAPRAHGGVTSTVACYLALANDLTPLLDPGAEDLAASSPECASQTANGSTHHRAANDPAPGTGDGESAKAPRVPSRDRGSRADGSGDAPRHRQRASRDEGHAPTMRPSSAL